jgi:hypothetical protein
VDNESINLIPVPIYKQVQQTAAGLLTKVDKATKINKRAL